MEGNNKNYDYWNQPSDYDGIKGTGSDDGYEPEQEKGGEKEEEKFNEDNMGVEDSRMPTFYEEVKIEWDRTKYNVWVTEIVKGGHTGYKIVGIDKIGEFDWVRRYREFFALRNSLRKRWVGFYVPGIPSKKPIGNKEESTVHERWYLFNKFMQDISLISHLWNSDEMNIFLRPKMDVEKSLNLMPRMTSQQMLERLVTYSNIDEQSAQGISGKYKDQLREFVISSKDIFKFLEGFKNFAKKLEQIRKMKIYAHSQLGGLLSKYEESTVAVYGLADFSNNRVISNTDNNSARDTLDAIPKNLDNPYRKFKHWIKEQLIDFHAIIEAISQRDTVEGTKNKAENKKRSAQSTLDKLNAGKKTLTTWFKSASAKANDITILTLQIAQCTVDIENYEKMVSYVDKYLGDIALPAFKKKVVQSYFTCMRELSASEQSNYSHLLEGWKTVYNAFNAKLQE